MTEEKDRLAAGDKVVHLTDPRLGRDIKAGMAVAEELVAQAEKSDRHKPMAEHLKRMQTSLSVPKK